MDLGLLKLYLLVIYEYFNIYVIYSVIPFLYNTYSDSPIFYKNITSNITSISTEKNVIILNLLLIMLFTIAQLFGYQIWHNFRKFLSINNIIYIYVCCMFITNIILMFSISIYMIYVYKFLLGLTSFMMMTTMCYVVERYADMNQKIGVFMVLVCGELGKILGTLAGGFLYRYQTSNFPFITIGGVSLGITLLFGIFYILFSDMKCIIKTKGIQQRQAREPIDLTPTNSDDEETETKWWIVFVMSLGIAMSNVYSDIFNVYLAMPFTFLFGKMDISMLVGMVALVSTLLSAVLGVERVRVFLTKYNIGVQVINGGLITLMSFVSVFDMNYYGMMVVLAILCSIIQTLFVNMVQMCLFYLSSIIDKKKLINIFFLCRNISLIIEVIFSTGLSLIFSLTTYKDYNNSIFWIIAAVNLIPAITYQLNLP